MAQFASRYYICTKEDGLFSGPGNERKQETVAYVVIMTSFCVIDAIYVLAFATIMLHTDAHNAQIKKKMSKQEWLKYDTLK